MTGLTLGFARLEHMREAAAEVDTFVAEFDNMVLDTDNKTLRTYTEAQIDGMRAREGAANAGLAQRS